MGRDVAGQFDPIDHVSHAIESTRKPVKCQPECRPKPHPRPASFSMEVPAGTDAADGQWSAPSREFGIDYLAEMRHREICELLEELIHELRRIKGDSSDPSGHSRD